MARFNTYLYLPKLSKGVITVENSMPFTIAEMEKDPRSWPQCESEIHNLEYEINILKSVLRRLKNKNPGAAGVEALN